jgi:uncharacterized protein (DUF3084 family)
MSGVYLIGVLVLTGGAIAFIGDRLGTKIGKKRLSIFGLRPRHTSIIITIITGICITTLTFAVMAAASENVRLALFGIDKLQGRMTDLSAQVENTSASLALAKQQKAEADMALSLAMEDVQALQDRQKELAEESKRLEAGNAELAARNEMLAGANESLGAQNGALLADNEVLAGSNEKLTSENGELETRNKELREGLMTVREGDITFRAGEIIASGVVRGNRPLDDVRADMQTLAQLAIRNVSAQLGENATDQDVWIYQPEFEAAIQTIADSKQDMVVRIVAAGNLVRGEPVRTSLQLYKNSIIYQAGEFILASPYHLIAHDMDESEAVVGDFLRQVNLAATDNGILPDPIRGSVGVIEGSQFYSIVQAVAESRGDIVLSAYAREATDAQGPLRLNVKLEELVGDENNGN